jgi:hypothetical protein
MNCEEIRTMIDREGALVTGEALAHVHDCAECAETWRQWQEVQRGLRAFGEEETPAFLHTRIMAHVRDADSQEAQKKGAWLFGLKKVWAGPVLVLFLGVLLGGYGLVQVLHSKKPEAQAPAAAKEGPTGKTKKDIAQQKNTAPGAGLEDKRAAAPQLPTVQVEPSPKPVPPAPAMQPETEPGAAPSKEERADELFAPSPAAAGPPPLAPHQTLASRSASEEKGEGAMAGNLAVRRQDSPDDRQKTAEASSLYAPAEPPPTDSSAAEVVCTLSSASGPGPYITLQLPPQAAPPSGGVWTLQVTEEGGVRIQDALGKTLSAPVPTVAAVVRPLHVPPGSYRLKRIS